MSTTTRQYPRTLADFVAANQSERTDLVRRNLVRRRMTPTFIDVLDENGDIVRVEEELSDGIRRCFATGCRVHFVVGISGVAAAPVVTLGDRCDRCARAEER